MKDACLLCMELGVRIMLGPKMGPTFLNGNTLNNVSALPTALTAFTECGQSRTWAPFSVTRVLQRTRSVADNTHGCGKF